MSDAREYGTLKRTTVGAVEAAYFALRAQAEAKSPETDPKRIVQLAKPLGFMNGAWEELKAQIEPGDELWEFCSSRESWEGMCGREGIQLVRAGEVIAQLITSLN